MSDDFVVTLAGYDWLHDAPFERKGAPAYLKRAGDILFDGGEEGITERIYDTGRVDQKALKFLLRNKYIKPDTRSPYELVQSIGRYDRDIGKILKTYVDIAYQKVVRDEDLDEAVFLLHDLTYGLDDAQDLKRLRRVLRSDRGAKIAALDSMVSEAHAGGLSAGGLSEGTPESLDLRILLNRLAER